MYDHNETTGGYVEAISSRYVARNFSGRLQGAKQDGNEKLGERAQTDLLVGVDLYYRNPTILRDNPSFASPPSARLPHHSNPDTNGVIAFCPPLRAGGTPCSTFCPPAVPAAHQDLHLRVRPPSSPGESATPLAAARQSHHRRRRQPLVRRRSLPT